MNSQVSAVILAGGQGLRMGGADKGLVLYHQQTLIAHVIRRIQPQVIQLKINANRHLEQYRAFGFEVIQDALNDYQGPLAGIQAGLASCTTEYCLFVPCDTPDLPDDLCQRLYQAMMEHQAEIAIARTEQTHPVICLVKADCLNTLTQFLLTGGRKVSAWQALHDCVQVDFGKHNTAFRNINFSAELE